MKIKALSKTLFALAAAALTCPAFSAEIYTAQLNSINPDLTVGDTRGEATFTVKENELEIEMEVKGATPKITHLQHIHGFESGIEAKCPPTLADKNNDGVIDLIETQSFTGVTMIPLHKNPAEMNIKSKTYPKANEDGEYVYRQTVSLDELERGFQGKFPDARLKLESRTVFVHGIPSDHQLPNSVGSLEGVPAQVTVPIACGEIRKTK